MAPSPAGEQRGVGRADHRSVRDPDVCELLVTNGGSEQVEVASDVGGAQVGQQIGVALHAGLAVGAGVGFQHRWIDGVRSGEVQRSWGVVGPAIDRGLAGPHPARVEADPVEASDGVEGDGGRRADELHPRPPRPARVEEQAADSVGLVDSGPADERELDRAPARAPMIEGDLSRSALEAVVAVGPVEDGDGRATPVRLGLLSGLERGPGRRGGQGSNDHGGGEHGHQPRRYGLRRRIGVPFRRGSTARTRGWRRARAIGARLWGTQGGAVIRTRYGSHRPHPWAITTGRPPARR